MSYGYYSDNQRIGTWIDEVYSSGDYIDGRKEGPWTTIESDSSIRKIENYKEGLLHGEQTHYTDDGNINWKAFCQNGELISTDIDSAVAILEEPPRFPGCENQGLAPKENKQCSELKMLQYIYSRINYPLWARQNNIEGLVLISFTVIKDGTISNVKVKNGVCAAMEKESLKLVDKLPAWIPGTVNGEPVDVEFTLPIRFKLR